MAIVGTHPTTRDQAPFQDPSTDIWVFNNQALQPWCPRVDAVFDMHPTEDIYRRAKEQLAFGKWLESDKKAVLYTPVALEGVPNNAVYPIDDVIADLLPNFKRGDEINEYFTSGPAYALALAIHKGYKRIELYGVEMESNAEYVYQRDGVGLFFGIALGRGIEVYMPKESIIFYAPRYGFDDTATRIDREAFETRASELQQIMENTMNHYQTYKGMLDSVVTRINAMNQAGATREEMGAVGEEYEKVVNDFQQAIADHAFVSGEYTETRRWQARVEKAEEYSGKAQEILGQNDGKWARVGDRMDLAGLWGETPLPGREGPAKP